ncbi:hypothetical protein POM88_000561 [Heracleum sosnowskyi]|uniref:Uncharacterized protein n=1 Tax=Heracleum sosnowskyi TaxID=360622 RepID=A0AAD8JC40_9APIA|nr:hypothetical protein POM88_000561 [Heracleum sosnowskyi]
MQNFEEYITSTVKDLSQALKKTNMSDLMLLLQIAPLFSVKSHGLAGRTLCSLPSALQFSITKIPIKYTNGNEKLTEDQVLHIQMFSTQVHIFCSRIMHLLHDDQVFSQMDMLQSPVQTRA